jgi:DNA-binding MarR family transcriptional regulator
MISQAEIALAKIAPGVYNLNPLMATKPSLVDSWHAVLDQHARVTAALEHALAEHELGVSEYEVLASLAEQRGNECRMHDLAESSHLSQSALSRVVARLEKDGLVERKMCEQDRRGIYAAITQEGLKRYNAARPAHHGVLMRELGG